MASAMRPASVRPLIFQSRNTGFRFSRRKNFLDQWLNRAHPSCRFSVFPYPHPAHLHPHFPLRPRRLPPLVGSRPYPLRSPLSSMTTPEAAGDSSQASQTKTDRVVVKGRVQGVFYRNWTIENATQLGLKGWVRNRRDGYVEALFSGSPEAVQEMEQRCRRGPPDAMVTALEVFPSNDDPGAGFVRRQTA